MLARGLQVIAVHTDRRRRLRDARPLDECADLCDELPVDRVTQWLREQTQLLDPIAHGGDALLDVLLGAAARERAGGRRDGEG